MAITLVVYVFLFAATYGVLQLGRGYLLALPIAAVAGLFMVRLFVLFHDCVHQSLFNSPLANKLFGYVCGALSFAAYEQWRHTHLIHHTTAGDLDRRGTGDVWTITVDEYAHASRALRAAYRIVRFPPVLFLVGPVWVFAVAYRFPGRHSRAIDVVSIVITDCIIAGIVVASSLTIGLRDYLLIQLPVLIVGGSVGFWLFYVQHQYEQAYWCRHEEWNRLDSALRGSSYYRLPAIFRWLTCSIGLHHVHHLRPRIPNYRLGGCLQSLPETLRIEPLSVLKSLRSLRLRLWDEQRGVMVGFRSPRAAKAQ